MKFAAVHGSFLETSHVSTCTTVRGCDSAATAADTVAPLHTPQKKELPALSVWGSLQGAEAVCTLMGVSLGTAKKLCASLQALRESPKSHTSVPEVHHLACPSAGRTPSRCSSHALYVLLHVAALLVTGDPSAAASCLMEGKVFSAFVRPQGFAGC